MFKVVISSISKKCRRGILKDQAYFLCLIATGLSPFIRIIN